MVLQVLEPVIRAYAPELIIVSAGFDAVQGDPLGGMNLTPQVFGHMTDRLSRLVAGGKLVLALEGGYNLRMTAECGAECVKVCRNSFSFSLWPHCCRTAAPGLSSYAQNWHIQKTGTSDMALAKILPQPSDLGERCLPVAKFLHVPPSLHIMTARSRALALSHHY